jgi:hypothetical protein
MHNLGPRAVVRIRHTHDGGVVGEEEVCNLLLDRGRVLAHTQVYGTSGILTNGLNYIGLSNDAAAPVATDVALASELSGSGLSRVQGTVTLPTGTGTVTTVENVFTYSGVSQGVQKAALFTAASGGVMAHEVQFTPRTLAAGDNFTVSFDITWA